MTKLFQLASLTAFFVATTAPAFAALSLADPRCEGLQEAPQIDTTAPRFSWRLDSDARGVRQTAYQIRFCTQIQRADDVVVR